MWLKNARIPKNEQQIIKIMTSQHDLTGNNQNNPSVSPDSPNSQKIDFG